MKKTDEFQNNEIKNSFHQGKENTSDERKKIIMYAGIITCSFLGALFLFVLISNLVIIRDGEKRIVSDEILLEQRPDCILILGAGVWSGNRPSHMLADRLEEGIRLYKEGISTKILVSGDHGRKDYDEVNVMKKYLMDAGVPSEDIFMDHAGFSTYESMYRAKEIFGVDNVVIVTQKYHMYRALYICKQLEIEATGSNSDPRKYRGELKRNIREWIARDKDIFTCLLNVKPKYLGDPIDIHGDGNVTNDDE